ncbi:alpha/beta hydrolase [Pseudoduganella violacea]|uniref:Pimeloyl-ACP methyl ester carboxylesterase n=1 Tax=Pseudoduganella violacea TaxID=1715466 RepID=A0A7W5BCU1_9BURK|nr:alpha/beta hydrolase [Pseudoduganella violacea]MBB3120460.1 pimeloyl-ACP methyl ester carboxylesterase [Pseudoduganella violacea]
MPRLTLALILPLMLSGPAPSRAQETLQRQELYTENIAGMRLHLRQVRGAAGEGRAILLLHGARVAGVGSFDLPVAGGSFAADLAQRGFDVYLLDVRGYGDSARPVQLEQAPSAHAPLVRSNEAVQDIGAAVEFIRQRRKGQRVALFGWATGGQWAGHYASLHPDRLSALIVLNSLYRGSTPHALIGKGSRMEHPAQPGRFNPGACGAYRLNEAASLARPWDDAIPEADKSVRRDPQVAQAYAQAALASDPGSGARAPASFRSPCGAFEDSFYLATGRQQWDASLITAPTLIVAGERDFWSRPEDVQNLAADLVHAGKVQVLRIPDASHFIHLERPQFGRAQLLDAIDAFVR